MGRCQQGPLEVVSGPADLLLRRRPADAPPRRAPSWFYCSNDGKIRRSGAFRPGWRSHLSEWWAEKGDRLVLFLSTVFAPSRFEAAARRLGEEGYEGKRGDSSVRALMGDGVVGRALFELLDDETAEGVVGSACRGVGAVLPSSAVGFLGRHLSPSTFPCAALLQPATFGAKLAIEVVEKQKRK